MDDIGDAYRRALEFLCILAAVAVVAIAIAAFALGFGTGNVGVQAG